MSSPRASSPVVAPDSPLAAASAAVTTAMPASDDIQPATTAPGATKTRKKPGPAPKKAPIVKPPPPINYGEHRAIRESQMMNDHVEALLNFKIIDQETADKMNRCWHSKGVLEYKWDAEYLDDSARDDAWNTGGERSEQKARKKVLWVDDETTEDEENDEEGLEDDEDEEEECEDEGLPSSAQPEPTDVNNREAKNTKTIKPMAKPRLSTVLEQGESIMIPSSPPTQAVQDFNDTPMAVPSSPYTRARTPVTTPSHSTSLESPPPTPPTASGNLDSATVPSNTVTGQAEWHKYDHLEYKQLLVICKQRDLPRRGNVDVLRDRLVMFDRDPDSVPKNKKRTSGPSLVASSPDALLAAGSAVLAGKKRTREEEQDDESQGVQKKKRASRARNST